jgi:hypothetical protein
LSDRDRPPLIVVGILATILGGLLLGPLAIRIFSGLAGRVSIAPWLALRDLVRYQARSGAALAAVTLASRSPSLACLWPPPRLDGCSTATSRPPSPDLSSNDRWRRPADTRMLAGLEG